MDEFHKYLLDNKILSPDLFQSLPAQRPGDAEPIYYRILKHHPKMEGPVWSALAKFLQVDLIDPHRVKLDESLANLVPVHLAHQYSIVPLKRTGNRLEIALADPRLFERCDELAWLIASGENGKSRDQNSQKSQKNIEFPAKDQPLQLLTVTGRLARPSHIANMMTSLYGIGADSVQDLIESQDPSGIQILETDVVDLSTDQEAGEDAAIIRFVNQLLLEAVKIGASDIHLEPFEKELRVRYRVDGFLKTEPVPPGIKQLEPAIISRIKIMAHLNIAEKRLAQDGQIRLKVMGRPIDVRVSVLPTMFGQGLALRILDRQVTFRQLDRLGMAEDYLRLFRRIVTLSHGLILVTGPTGSGKTTTLYASINEINTLSRKIITVEDPIEYQMEGISQIQVNPVIHLDFAGILRNILRHDPDVIMVGEIRDTETAKMAISAAMTGHLVFSTLHTNDAPSAPVRLIEMGLEPYLVSSSLEAVIAQRLVRLLCVRCRKPVVLDDSLPSEVREALAQAETYENQSCPHCHHEGYRGRAAIFEMFSLNDQIRKLILNRANTPQIRNEALDLGMHTLYQSGLRKVAQGLTSLAEVYRVARDETVNMKQTMQK